MTEVVLGKAPVSSQGQVHLPKEVLPFLPVTKGQDSVEFILGPNREIIIRKEVRKNAKI